MELKKHTVGSLAVIHKLKVTGTSWQITWLQASVELSNLVQGTLGWIAGCAWSDLFTYLTPSMNAPSTTALDFASNVGVAVAFTLVAVAWLACSGEDPSTVEWNEALDRSDVEQYFVTGAMSFFVGWACARPAMQPRARREPAPRPYARAARPARPTLPV